MTFNEAKDKWFSEVVDAPRLDSEYVRAIKEIVDNVDTECDHDALLMVFGNAVLAHVNHRVPWAREVYEFVKKIESGEFKEEFRFTYGGNQLGSKVSQTSSFFSSLRQALNYSA